VNEGKKRSGRERERVRERETDGKSFREKSPFGTGHVEGFPVIKARPLVPGVFSRIIPIPIGRAPVPPDAGRPMARQRMRPYLNGPAFKRPGKSRARAQVRLNCTHGNIRSLEEEIGSCAPLGDAPSCSLFFRAPETRARAGPRTWPNFPRIPASSYESHRERPPRLARDFLRNWPTY
jgi:hypothetical protein